MTPRPITVRQMLVLEFIHLSIRRYERPPTVREIGAYMKIRSTNGVNDHLNSLERRGLLVRDPGVARGLYLTASGKALMGDSALTGLSGACSPPLESRCSFALRRVA